MTVSGMVPMFLSAQGIETGVCVDEKIHHRPRKILIACSGERLELSSAAKQLAFGFGRKDARSTIYRIPKPGEHLPAKDLNRYDGIFIGIAPDGTGVTDTAFSFMRTHLGDLAAKPVALFFLLSRAPKLGQAEQPDRIFDGLSQISPLDVITFQRSDKRIAGAVTAWAEHQIWPLLETGWLADMIFPCPEHAFVPEAGVLMPG